MSGPESPIDVGVTGVGLMGQNHARVYDDLSVANLIGVHDVDEERAAEVADRYDTSAMALGDLLDRVDALSVAVPTEHHYDVASACIEAKVAPLVEKPVVDDLETGRQLRTEAERAGVPVAAGHVERFNPAVDALADLLDGRTIYDIRTKRLGPPPGRSVDDSAVFDLMIHDIDVVLSLLEETPTAVKSSGVADNGHVSALLEFGSGPIVSLTASHRTQRKVRTLRVTADTCLIELDYVDQSIAIHRNSTPAYLEDDDGLRYRHESVVEQLQIPNEEPLKAELESFLESVASWERPRVPLEDGLAAIEIADRIERQSVAGRTVAEDPIWS